MNIKLTGVARGSFGELLEDYKDFLRTRRLKIWEKDDVRLLPIRKMRIARDEPDKSNRSNWANESNLSNWSNRSNWTNWSNKSNRSNGSNLSNWFVDPERFANLMVTLISKENYLLDQMIRSLENKFIKEGGYSENLTRQRLDQKKKLVWKNWIDSAN